MTWRLVAAAPSRGVRWLYAFVLPGNPQMLGLLRSLGLPMRTRFADGVDRVELDLTGLQERGSDVAIGTPEPQLAA